MSDAADRAGPRIEHAVADGINDARRALASQSLAAIGVCHWCESPVASGRVFCSPDCRDDWQHDHDRRRAMGQK